MSKELGVFEKAAAKLVTKLPPKLAMSFNLSGNACSRWFARNGHFKFDVGEKLKANDLHILGAYEKDEELTVEGHTQDLKCDAYVMKRTDGSTYTDFKANIESYFRSAPEATEAKTPGEAKAPEKTPDIPKRTM